jgi:hypothetical protein
MFRPFARRCSSLQRIANQFSYFVSSVNVFHPMAAASRNRFVKTAMIE